MIFYFSGQHRTFTVPFDSKLKKKKKYKKVKKFKVDKHQELIPWFSTDRKYSQTKRLNYNFAAICETPPGSTSRDPKYDSKLICRYQHHSSPYLKLGPFKVEELNKEPFVVLLHDFMPNTECNEIISKASTNLKMSQTGFRQDTKNDFSTRTSKQAWIEDQTFVPLNETNIKGKKVSYHVNILGMVSNKKFFK